jgi:hypothetical protein
MAEDEDATSVRAPQAGKRKTTYPRDHPTENPKPPKRSKADVQQAARERREAEKAKKAAAEAEKKKKIVEAEEKRKLSIQRIASIEDAVQRSQKRLQSHSERPDLNTMETYKEEIQRQKDVEVDSEPEVVANQDIDDLEGEPEDKSVDISSDGIGLDFPPESAADTDSDGMYLGLEEGEGDGSDKDGDYNDKGDSDAGEEESDVVSDDPETNKHLEKKNEGKKKVRIGSFRVVKRG